MTEGKSNLIHLLLDQYDIQSAEDIQDALKDLLAEPFKDMLEAEMDDHLGIRSIRKFYEPDYRNGHKSKTVHSNYGVYGVEVPQDRQNHLLNHKYFQKRQKDISSIDEKIISMYAKGMTTRQIFRNHRRYLWF